MSAVYKTVFYQQTPTVPPLSKNEPCHEARRGLWSLAGGAPAQSTRGKKQSFTRTGLPDYGCTSLAGMDTKRLIRLICVLVLIVVYINLVNCSGTCLLNKCLCTATRVNCDRNSNPNPTFTIPEKIHVRYITLRWSHLDWFKMTCTDYPVLDYVFIGLSEPSKDKQCPTLPACGDVIVQCL